MARVFTYVVLLAGLIGTFSILAVPGSASSELLRALSFNDFSLIKVGELFTTVAGILSVAALVSAIIIGTFTRASPESFIMASFVSLLGGWLIGDLYLITTIYSSLGPEYIWIANVVRIIMFAFAAGLIISLVEFWRGAD